ncbi:MAG: T9SS type A sorting domain-containing protein [Bacteroidota bacterium]|nr:T9SS type A sorting domain-containing protein [Bacteroidota bacterium]
MKKVIINFIVLNSLLTMAQTPGGVNAGLLTGVGLDVWLKADNGVTGTNSVTAWANNAASGSSLNVIGSPSLNTVNSSFNYNPYVYFKGLYNSRQYLAINGNNNLTGVDYKSFFYVVKLDSLQRIATHLATVEGVSGSLPANGTLHGGVNGGLAAILQQGVDADFEATGVWERNSASVTYSVGHTTNKNIISAISNITGPTTINRFFGGQQDWGPYTGCKRDWLGPVAELIACKNVVNTTEKNKILSYLAIKYGITLPIDYINTAIIPATIYNTTASGTYTNNIIGIGREDSEGLSQKQSHTEDDSTIIYIGNLFSNNPSNPFSFLTDHSYIMCGADKGKLCSTVNSNTEIPVGCGITSRIEREWRVQRSNSNDVFYFEITLPSAALTGISTWNLKLLVDNDGNFANGGTQCYYTGDGLGTVIYTAGTPLRIGFLINTNHISNNSTKYITLASTNTITPLPIELIDFSTNCVNTNVNIKWQTASEKNVDYYEIQKSYSGQDDWKIINKTIPNNSKQSTNTYSFIDEDDSYTNDVVYYKLIEKDLDAGEKTLKTIVTERCNKNSLADLIIYPNPANTTITLKNYLKVKKLIITNPLGQIVYETPISGATYDISTLTNGIYYAECLLEDGSVEKVIKIIKN